MSRHQIIRQVQFTPAGKMEHTITCTCGRRIAHTASLITADRKAQYHLEVADADEQYGADSAAEQLERGPR